MSWPLRFRLYYYWTFSIWPTIRLVLILSALVLVALATKQCG